MVPCIGFRLPGSIGAVVAMLAVAACSPRPAPDLTIAAASSLAPIVDALVEDRSVETGAGTSVVLGASVDLAEQIRSGAPIDLFLSADPDLLVSLQAEGLVAGEPLTFAQGGLSLALSEEASGLGPPALELLLDPGIDVLVIADPAHAPFGIAAREALRNAGLWDSLRDRVVFAGTARQALDIVETGNAQAGIVPTSLLAGANLASIPVPEDLYTLPRYAGAVISTSEQIEGAAAFLNALRSDRGRAILLAGGLIPIDPP